MTQIRYVSYRHENKTNLRETMVTRCIKSQLPTNGQLPSDSAKRVILYLVAIYQRDNYAFPTMVFRYLSITNFYGQLLTRHFKLYILNPQQSTRQRRPFANDKEAPSPRSITLRVYGRILHQIAEPTSERYTEIQSCIQRGEPRLEGF